MQHPEQIPVLEHICEHLYDYSTTAMTSEIIREILSCIMNSQNVIIFIELFNALSKKLSFTVVLTNW